MPKGDGMIVAFGMENDEKLIDGHYGDSEFFAIYEITPDGNVKFLEKRENKAKVMEEREHGDVEKFRAVISQLADVDLLAAYRMGPNFLRIRDNTNKQVFFTRTRDLKKAIENLLAHLREKGYIRN